MLLIPQAEAQAVQQVNHQFPIVFIAIGILMLIIFLLIGLFAVSIIRVWARGFFSAAEIPLTDILGMKLRKTNANIVVDCRIMSVQAGTPVSVKQIETAYLSGADVVMTTRAYVDAAKSGKDLTFKELADASRSETLAKLLAAK